MCSGGVVEVLLGGGEGGVAIGGQCCVKPGELRLSDGAHCLYH